MVAGAEAMLASSRASMDDSRRCRHTRLAADMRQRADGSVFPSRSAWHESGRAQCGKVGVRWVRS